MKKFFSEFKEFAMQGNVLDLAVGVIIGASFGKIVSSLVADVFTPIIGLIVGGVSFVDLKLVLKPEYTDAAGKLVPAATLNYGNFLQNTFDFIIVAVCVFGIVQGINTLKKAQQRKDKKVEIATQKEVVNKQEVLLTEIRDLLAKQK